MKVPLKGSNYPEAPVDCSGTPGPFSAPLVTLTSTLRLVLLLLFPFYKPENRGSQLRNSARTHRLWPGFFSLALGLQSMGWRSSLEVELVHSICSCSRVFPIMIMRLAQNSAKLRATLKRAGSVDHKTLALTRLTKQKWGRP